MNLAPVLVIGATGATGRHVVQQFLDQGRRVKAIVRSKERMLSMVDLPPDRNTQLEITEATVLDISEENLYEHVKDTQAVVVCLGHAGVSAQPRRLVLDSVKRLSAAMIKATKETSPTIKPKLVVMSSVGVPNPDGTDDRRRFVDRLLLKIFLFALHPHIDNEETAVFVHSLGKDSGIEWAVVRPTDLIDGPVRPFNLYDKPQGNLFGDGVSTRANVAQAMVNLVTDNQLWEKYKFNMPTIYDQVQKGE
jgi:nucleoside-diphosphate-sugar epimerase